MEYDEVNAAETEELFERLAITVAGGQEPLRIDKFLMNRIEGATRNKIQQSIDAGRVLVNEKNIKSNYKVRPDDKIIIYETNLPDSGEIVPEQIPFKIEYEDEDLLIVNKEAGMVVHPGSGNPNGTLINAVAWHLKQQDASIEETDLPRFGLVHRIDKNTSGLLVLAKTANAMTSLAKQFFDHTVFRRYVALVWADFDEDEGTINAHVGRNQRYRKLFAAYPEGEYGKEAITHYKVLERFHYVTLLECRLETGRTHQIRVHMQHIGHPVFNDDTYGGDKIVKGTVYSKYKQFVDNCFQILPRQALHAQKLGFIHPSTKKEMFFESGLPGDISAVVNKWRAYTLHRQAQGQ